MINLGNQKKENEPANKGPGGVNIPKLKLGKWY